MGITIENPDRFERFCMVGRKDRPGQSWPTGPHDPDLPPNAWLLLGFLDLAGDVTAVYGLLRKEDRQAEDWAERVQRVAMDALNRHNEKALTKAQVVDALKDVLAEIA